jgi:hypothetical protein
VHKLFDKMLELLDLEEKWFFFLPEIGLKFIVSNFGENLKQNGNS